MPLKSEKLQRSWILFKTSLEVILGNRKLLFCSMATVGFAVAIMFFFVLAPVTPLLVGLTKILRDVHASKETVDHVDLYFDNTTRAMIYMSGAYLVSMFSWTFASVALSHEIMRALSGDDVSIRRGILFALRRIRSIFVWSMFAGSIGILIRCFEARLGWLGKIVLGGLGVLWSAAAVFAIPVMIREESANPITLLQRSAGTVRKTWGETLAGNLGHSTFSLLGGLMSLCIMAFGMALMIVLNQWWLLPISIIVTLVSAIGFMTVAEAANQIYCCSLYVYATEGVIPCPFSQEQMDQAWTIQKR